MNEFISLICTTLGIAGAWLVAKKRIEGFYCWVPGNIGWILYFFWQKEWAASGLFAVYLYFAVIGILNWRKNE